MPQDYQSDSQAPKTAGLVQSRFSLREMFLATFLCAAPLAFRHWIGSPAAICLVCMALSLVLGRGGLTAFFLCMALVMSSVPMDHLAEKLGLAANTASTGASPPVWETEQSTIARVVISTCLGVVIAFAPWLLSKQDKTERDGL